MRNPPMLLGSTTLETLPRGEEWWYEPKFDGERIVAEIGQRVMLLTRQNNNVADTYPNIANQLPAAIIGENAVLDGEIIGVRESGIHHHSTTRSKETVNAFVVFDILEHNGEPLINEPLHARRKLLEKFFRTQSNVVLCPIYQDPDTLLQAIIELDMEGLVAKNKNSRYTPGKRSKDWLKLKRKHYR